MNKGHLDRLLKAHKAQPVGDGYIDIIVTRENYKSLIHNLIENSFVIESISWWEWCEGKNKNRYGMGGPPSYYYNGWFAEIPIETDNINSTDLESRDIIELINKVIETKSIEYPNETIRFSQSKWLTPGLWLKVPDEWKNEFCA